MPTEFEPSEFDAVEEVNHRFYRAMENGDLEELSKIWLHEDWVKCVHPGSDLLIGWKQVEESLNYIFSRPGGIQISTSDFTTIIEGDFAVVSCYENIAFFLDQGSAPISARMAATNLYRRVDGLWRMIHHHASQVSFAPTTTESDMIH